jgi:xylan 1,4-beta-xylosidase
MLSSRDRPDAALQRAGHGNFVETQDGESYFVHLCGRPLRNRGRSVLGRETAIQKVVWGDDGWPRLDGDAGLALAEVSAPKLPAHPFPAEPTRHDFDGPELPLAFQWLRTPCPDDIFSLTARPGHLRLIGRESIGSPFTQALVARRQQSFCYSARTVIDFAPRHFQQMAGLVCYYNSTKFHYLYISHDEELGRHLRVMSALPDSTQADAFTDAIALLDGPVHLRVEVDEERLLFAYSLDGESWIFIDRIFDASILSDEASAPGMPNFTGAFVGMACQDMSGDRLAADFDFFDYRERDYLVDPRR